VTIRRLWHGLAIAAGLLTGLILGALAVVYARSELILRQRHTVPHHAVTVPTDAAAIAEGKRLATLVGCSGQCHGRDAHGAVMFDDPLIARVVAPSLPRAVHQYDAAQLDAIIRHGVRPDGRTVIVMPAESYQAMNDADLGRIIAYLRSLPVEQTETLPATRAHLLGRVGFTLGKFRPVTQLVSSSPLPPPAAAQVDERGRYLARIVCGHCHGTDLRGASNPEFTSPPLQAVRGYNLQEFTTLVRTGQAMGRRELKIMRPVARRCLALMTEDEIAALYRYLHALPD
jgi:cytochrome c553